MIQSSSCYLCGNPTIDLAFQNLEDHSFKNQAFKATFVRCSKCSLIYQCPQPPEEIFASIYPDNYAPYSQESAKFRSSLVDYGLKKRWNFVSKLKPGGRLLDVGCATGEFLAFMRKNPRSKWDLYGVEINPVAADYARSRYQLEVATGSLSDLNYPENHFDVITLWEVLEHLRDPVETLKTIHRLLKPEGILVLRVPNGDSCEARFFGPDWAGLDPPRHLFVFNIHSLRYSLNLAGFKVVAASCQSGIYASFRLSLQFWLAANPKSSRKWLYKTLRHPVVELLMFPAFFYLSRTLNGSSLVITAQKPGR